MKKITWIILALVLFCSACSLLSTKDKELAKEVATGVIVLDEASK